MLSNSLTIIIPNHDVHVQMSVLWCIRKLALESPSYCRLLCFNLGAIISPFLFFWIRSAHSLLTSLSKSPPDGVCTSALPVLHVCD